MKPIAACMYDAPACSSCGLAQGFHPGWGGKRRNAGHPRLPTYKKKQVCSFALTPLARGLVKNYAARQQLSLSSALERLIIRSVTLLLSKELKEFRKIPKKVVAPAPPVV